MVGTAGLALALTALVVGGCQMLTVPVEIAISHQDPPVDPTLCMAALVQGELVPHSRWGVALRDPDGLVWQVLWPSDYTGVMVNGALVLRDAADRDAARAGDLVEVSGGESGDLVWLACPDDPIKPWSGGQ